MLHPASISPASYLRSRAGRVCVALRGATVSELLSRAQAALAESHFLEFRLDSVDHPAKAVPAVAELLSQQKDAAASATCRRKAFGGSFAGTLADELKILTAAAKAGCGLLDLEIESAEECTPAALDALREAAGEAGAALLIS